MPLVYKPYSQFMTPNNTPINPRNVDNTFSTQVSTQTYVSAYSAKFFEYPFNPTKSWIHEIDYTEVSPIYNGQYLDMVLPRNTGYASTTESFAWQVTLYSEKITCLFSNTDNYIVIQAGGLNTNDAIMFIKQNSSDTLPSGLEFNKTYYLSLADYRYNFYLTDFPNGTQVQWTPPTPTYQRTLCNVAQSNAVPFKMAYPLLMVISVPPTIGTQSFTFLPTRDPNPIYNDAPLFPIKSFVANLYSKDKHTGVYTLADTSGEQFTTYVGWTFHGMVSGEKYAIEYLFTDTIGQTFTLEKTDFNVSYVIPDVFNNPVATASCSTSGISISVDKLIQLLGNVSGNYHYIDNFLSQGTAIQLDTNAILNYQNPKMVESGAFPIIYCKFTDVNYTGRIFMSQNLLIDRNFGVSYHDGGFYRVIDGQEYLDVIMPIDIDKMYLIYPTLDRIYIKEWSAL